MPRKSCIACHPSSRVATKVYFNVPKHPQRRKAWFLAVGEPNVPKGNAYYCCEDHFDLEQDCSNWMRYKLMKGITLKLKDDIIPHKNLANRNPNDDDE